MSTRLVATVLVTDIATAADALKHPMDGVDYVELRFDALAEPSPEAVSEILALPRMVPVIATCRAVAHGGLFTDEEPERIALLAAAAGLGIVHVQPVEADGIVHQPSGGGGGCGSGGGGCGSGGCGS